MAITLDKARLVLQQPGQSQEAPLCSLSDEETAEHLWSGEGPCAVRAAFILFFSLSFSFHRGELLGLCE